MHLIIEILTHHLTILFALIMAIFLGFELISKVPTVLHTPLMSGANAISGVVIIGAIILVTINVVGGHAVTNRMLQMFRKK